MLDGWSVLPSTGRREIDADRWVSQAVLLIRDYPRQVGFLPVVRGSVVRWLRTVTATVTAPLTAPLTGTVTAPVTAPVTVAQIEGIHIHSHIHRPPLPGGLQGGSA
jgi:hypothetical protein